MERSIRLRFRVATHYDALLGLLLVRAPNVRAIVREQEMAASRGVLAAPSQQNLGGKYGNPKTDSRTDDR